MYVCTRKFFFMILKGYIHVCAYSTDDSVSVKLEEKKENPCMRILRCLKITSWLASNVSAIKVYYIID